MNPASIILTVQREPVPCDHCARSVRAFVEIPTPEVSGDVSRVMLCVACVRIAAAATDRLSVLRTVPPP